MLVAPSEQSLNLTGDGVEGKGNRSVHHRVGIGSIGDKSLMQRIVRGCRQAEDP